MKKVYELLSIKQLDEKLNRIRDVYTIVPKNGWIEFIREALGMSVTQLAKLMGIAQPSAWVMEKREVNKKITLETLENAANAMDCELVYAFVPKTSFEDFILKKQHEIVDKIIKDTNLTMSLEDQGLQSKELKYQKELLLTQLKNKPLKELWRDL